jgi:hypothetical protein
MGSFHSELCFVEMAGSEYILNKHDSVEDDKFHVTKAFTHV